MGKHIILLVAEKDRQSMSPLPAEEVLPRLFPRVNDERMIKIHLRNQVYFFGAVTGKVTCKTGKRNCL